MRTGCGCRSGWSRRSAGALLLALFVTLRILLSGGAEAGRRDDRDAAFDSTESQIKRRRAGAAATAPAAADHRRRSPRSISTRAAK